MKKLITILLILITSNLYAESTFSGERLKKACINYAYSILGNDIEISIKQNIQDEVFEQDNVIAKCTGNSKNLRGNCYIGIEFYESDRLIRRIEIPARIKIWSTVPIALKSMHKGEIIDENSITYEKRDITYINYEIVSLEKILGKRINANITAGNIITGGLIENNKTIHRGDQVRIIAQSGAVRISSSGKALQDATIGQKIRIQREGTRDILEGYIARDGNIYLIKN